MMPVINLFHHIIGNLFNFSLLLCLLLIVVTTINAIFLLVGRRHPAAHHDWRHRRQFATSRKRQHLRRPKNVFKYLGKTKEQQLSN